MGTVGKVGIGAGIGVAAAAAAIALVATSGASGTAVPATNIGAASNPPAASSPLGTLAAYVKKNYRPTGDASVVIQTQKIGDKAPTVQYFVYADNGAIYGAGSLRGLPAAVAAGETDGPASGIAANIKAAISAANGDLSSGVISMIDCTPNYLGLGLSPAAQKAEWAKGYAAAKVQDAQLAKEKGTHITPRPLNAKTAKEEADNLLWTNSFIAMSDDGGNPAVRAGVLRLLSTISAVTVAHTTTDGRATLTITAGPEVFGGQGSQVVVIDAKSGELISSVTDLGASLQSVETYKVSRTTLAKLKAGKF